MEGPFADPSILFFEGFWYLFATDAVGLRLYVTDDLVAGRLIEHPTSPLTNDPRYRRCGGMPICIDGQLVRFAQDGSHGYGSNLHVMIVEKISPTTYSERVHSADIFTGNHSWNATGGHHLHYVKLADGRTAVAVDGKQHDYYLHKFVTRLWRIVTGYQSRPSVVLGAG